jgi:hypothetical protein
MNTSKSLVGSLFLVAMLVPSLALAQFGFSIGGGGGSGSHYGGGNQGGISFGFGTGGGSGYGNNHGHSHSGYGNSGYGDGYRQPSWGINLNSGSNNQYSRPAPRYSQPRQSAPATGRSKALPEAQANVKPAVTNPNKNKILLAGRHITAEEIERAKKYFQLRLAEFAKTIDGQLPASDADIGAVLARLVANDVAADVQIRLIDALRSGNVELAREIWTAAVPGEAAPFGMPRMRIRFASFCDRLHAGTCTMEDVEQLGSDLSEMGMNEEPCCGAESLLDDVKEHLLISQAVQRAVPGKPSVPVATAAGEVEIAYHPGLPDGSIVVLDAGTVMIGTGGVGRFEMERGNVATALGYPLAKGEPLPENTSKLVRNGVLIENPTADTINYVVDRSQFSMEPGYRQTFTPSGSSIIKFDRGNGGKAATYSLASGTYQFVIKDKGWDLQQAKFAVTIDNSQNSEPFNYIVQGEHAVVAAGGAQSHKSDFPLVIRYDRGNGGATKQVLYEQPSGTLQVAVNTADNLWDLFGAPRASKALDAPPAAEDFAPAF